MSSMYRPRNQSHIRNSFDNLPEVWSKVSYRSNMQLSNKKGVNMQRNRTLRAAIICALLATILGVGFVLAQETPPNEVPIDPAVASEGLISAIGSGNFGLIVAFGLMIAVWILRKFVLKKLNSKWLPWISTILGGLGAFATALAIDPKKWLTAILSGVEAGLAAAGYWGLTGIARNKQPK